MIQYQTAIPLLCGILILLFGSINIRYGLIFTIIFYAFLPDTMGLDMGFVLPYLTGRRIVQIFFIILFLFHLRSTREKPQFPKGISKYFLIFISLQILSSLFSVDIVASFKNVGEQIIFFYSFFYIFSAFDFSEEQIRSILKTLVVSAFVLSILGIFEFFLKQNIFELIKPVRPNSLSFMEGLYRENYLRIQSSFGHPISFGLFLITALLVSLWLSSNSKNKNIWLFISLFLIVAVFLTLSRGPIFGMFVTLVILFLGRGIISKKRLTCTLSATLLFVTIIISAVGAKGFLESFAVNTFSANPASESSFSTMSRIALYKVIFSTVQDRPLIGFGPGTSTEGGYLIGYSVDTRVTFNDITTYYFQILIEGGFLSLISFMVLIFVLLTPLKRVKIDPFDEERKADLRQVVFAMAVGFLIVLLSVNVKNSMPIFWMLLGIAHSRRLNPITLPNLKTENNIE
jgi:O-antigen ligase